MSVGSLWGFIVPYAIIATTGVVGAGAASSGRWVASRRFGVTVSPDPVFSLLGGLLGLAAAPLLFLVGGNLEGVTGLSTTVALSCAAVVVLLSSAGAGTAGTGMCDALAGVPRAPLTVHGVAWVVYGLIVWLWLGVTIGAATLVLF